jgi:hypothetical protein
VQVYRRIAGALPMSDLAASPVSADLLALGAAGDVIAARRLARAFLASGRAAPQDTTLALLVLTAACLDVHARSGEEINPRAVAAYLRRMASEKPPAASLAESPMQFARYAAAEFRSRPVSRRTALVAYLVDLTSRQALRQTGLVAAEK